MFKFVADSCLKHVEPYLDAQPSLEAEMKTKIRQRAQVSSASSSSICCPLPPPPPYAQLTMLTRYANAHSCCMPWRSSSGEWRSCPLSRSDTGTTFGATPSSSCSMSHLQALRRGGGPRARRGAARGTGKGTHQTPPFESETPPEVGVPPVGTVFFFLRQNSQKSVYCGFVA
jgi:hypothetical protein